MDFGVSLAMLAGPRWTFWAPGHLESRPLFAVLGRGGFDFVVVCGVLWYVGYGGLPWCRATRPCTLQTEVLCLDFASSLLGQMGSAQMRCHGWEGSWIWTCTTPQRKRTYRRVRLVPIPGGGLLKCVVLLLGLTVRVGEALHPGPAESERSQWTLGVANPSGLNGKLDQAAHLEGDAWLLTETQLSRQGVSAFQKGLKMLKSPWKYAIPGSPCAPRRHTETGSHTGVMVLSKLPARALPHEFSVDSYATSRVQVVGIAVADVWVTLGVLYGVPCNSQHKQARYQTDALLADLVDRVA